MKWTIVFLLFGAITARAQQPTPPENYEDLGWLTWEDLGLHGKVKTLKECKIYSHSEDCHTYNFNIWGVAYPMSQGRQLKQSINNVLVFEGRLGDCLTEEHYLEGKHVLLKYTCTFPNGKPRTSETQFVYEKGRLIRKLRFFEKNLSDLQKYTYQINGSYQVDSYKGEKLYLQEFYDSRWFLIKEIEIMNRELGVIFENNFTYETDNKDNWVKQFREGELSRFRIFTYY